MKNDAFSIFNSSAGGSISFKAFSDSLPTFMSVKSSIHWETLSNCRAITDSRAITSSFLFVTESTYPHSNRGTNLA